jgi:hypothetical protein
MYTCVESRAIAAALVGALRAEDLGVLGFVGEVLTMGIWRGVAGEGADFDVGGGGGDKAR